jgi:type VI secretion system protein ImpL
MDEKYDDAGDNSRDNLVFPPTSLGTMFPDRADVLKIIESTHFKKDSHYQEVDGPYTEKGHALVVRNLATGSDFLADEAWVVPLTREEKPDQVPTYLKGVSDLYEQTFIQQWTDFFTDLKVKSPTSADEAMDIWRVLSTTEYPLRRILFRLEDHTQWKKADPLEGRDGVAKVLNQRLNQKLAMNTRGLQFKLDIRKLGEKTSVIPEKFHSLCSFGSEEGKDTGVQQYAEILRTLRAKLVDLKNQSAAVDLRQMNDDLADAQKKTTTLLSHYDPLTQKLLGPVLSAPITIGTRENLTPKVDSSQLTPDQKPPPGQKPITQWQMPKIPGR